MRSVYMNADVFKTENNETGAYLPFSESTEILGDKTSINGKTAENRLVCQAMEGCDGTEDGRPGELTKRRYRRFAEGGAGIIWFEATAVLPEGRANPHQLYINENTLDAFKAQVEEIKETALKQNGFEPIVIMQATHSGRYSKPNGVPEPLIAYNNPVFEKDAPIPADRIVTDEYLDRVGEALVKGALLAEKAGFDGADIKCCHRYLNSELLSAYNRGGRYGGSFENRTRLIRETVGSALKACGKDFIITSRLNVYDGFAYPNGFGVKKDGTLEFDPIEPIKLINELKDLGVELLNITMGNPYFNPHVNRPFSAGAYTPDEHPLTGVARVLKGTEQIKKQVGDIKLICSALSYLGTVSPNVAAAFIERGAFEYAGFGRMILAYPDFARDILRTGGLKKEKCCIACSKCTQIMRSGGTPGCVIRDSEAYMPIYRKYCMNK